MNEKYYAEEYRMNPQVRFSFLELLDRTYEIAPKKERFEETLTGNVKLTWVTDGGKLLVIYIEQSDGRIVPYIKNVPSVLDDGPIVTEDEWNRIYAVVSNSFKA